MTRKMHSPQKELQGALREAMDAEYEIPSGADSIGPIPLIKTSEQAQAVVDRILKRAGFDLSP